MHGGPRCWLKHRGVRKSHAEEETSVPSEQDIIVEARTAEWTAAIKDLGPTNEQDDDQAGTVCDQTKGQAMLKKQRDMYGGLTRKQAGRFLVAEHALRNGAAHADPRPHRDAPTAGASASVDEAGGSGEA